MSFLSALGSIGSAASGASSLIGAVGSFFGGKKKPPNFDDQMWMNQQAAGKMMEATFGKAKELGINPLYAAGLVSPNVPQWQSFGGDTSTGWADTAMEMGQNIGRAIGAIQSDDERAFSAITAKQAVERGELENELLKTQIAQMRSANNPPVFNGGHQIVPGQAQTSTGLAATIANIPTNKLGVADQMDPFWTVQYDQNGNPVRVYNSGNNDNDTMMALTSPVSLMDLIHGNFVKPAAKRLSKFWRRTGNDLRSATPYRKSGFYK